MVSYTCEGCGANFESNYPTAWGKCEPCQIKHMEPGFQKVKDLFLKQPVVSELDYNSPFHCYAGIQNDPTVDHTKQCPNCLAPTRLASLPGFAGYTCTDNDCQLYWSRSSWDGKVGHGTPTSGGWNAPPYDPIELTAKYAKSDADRIRRLEEMLRASHNYSFKNFLEKMELKRILRRGKGLESPENET